MLYPEVVKGFVQYGDIAYPFSFSRDSFILELMPPSAEVMKQNNIQPLMESLERRDLRPKWVERILLHAEAADGRQVIFCVPERPQNYLGFISFHVIWYLHYDNKIAKDQYDGFSVYGGEINRFFDPGRAVNRELSTGEDGKREITARSVDVGNAPMGSYRICKGVDAKMCVSAFASYPGDNPELQLEASSVLYTDFSSGVTVDILINAVYNLKRFLQYITYRSCVELSQVSVYKLEGDKRCIFGRLYFAKCEISEIHKMEKLGIIQYTELGTKSWHLFSQIKYARFSVDHLLDYGSRIDGFTVGGATMVIANFEREFELIYGKNRRRSKLYIDTLEEVITAVDEMISNNMGKKKKYLKQIKTYLNNRDDSLADRISFAFVDCEQSIRELLWVQGEMKDWADQVGSDIQSFRNAAAHCKMGYVLPAQIVIELRFLEMLTYAIRLKWLKLEPEKIAKALNDLFCCNYYYR